ncbi:MULTISPECIES: hypothetical protein [Acinetobacter]|uniref:hypothetical protein n=1 Tax=Acinetobacter TaxID=469 RepID=UPI000C4FF006|nr:MULTISPECIES: hypothetical protein [Acinetobacter]MBC68513.1 hypothetical protein [Acinetobacter sp.]MBT50550.1 hypothetical protein [Acinetobacter sp.]HIQ34196.1 hypothetical protein [Acinetobacter venetianus]HJP47911.1 hypothetical protein [Acinetobacter venetianus]|tara:strand:+ start:1105 stop:1371 length:267 start_codon:yes stop_codon:yes gene_type:complete
MQTSEQELLQEILLEVKQMKQQLARVNEERVCIEEFCRRLNWKKTKFYDRIHQGEITPPIKDGRFSYYLNSYVNEVVTRESKSDTLAA